MHFFAGLVALWLSGPGWVGKDCLDNALADKPIIATRELGDRIAVCFGEPGSDEDAGSTCAVLDPKGQFMRTLAGQVVHHLVASSEPPFTATLAGTQLTVCETATKICARAQARYPAMHGVGAIGVSDDGHRVVIVDGTPRPDGSSHLDIDIVSMPTGRKLSRFSFGETNEEGPDFRLTAQWEREHLLIGFMPAGPTMWNVADPRTGRRVELASDIDSHAWFGNTAVVVSGKIVQFVDTTSFKLRAERKLPGNDIGGTPDAAGVVVLSRAGRAMIAMASPPAIVPVNVARARLDKAQPLPLCKTN